MEPPDSCDETDSENLFDDEETRATGKTSRQAHLSNLPSFRPPGSAALGNGRLPRQNRWQKKVAFTQEELLAVCGAFRAFAVVSGSRIRHVATAQERAKEIEAYDFGSRDCDEGRNTFRWQVMTKKSGELRTAASLNPSENERPCGTSWRKVRLPDGREQSIEIMPVAKIRDRCRVRHFQMPSKHVDCALCRNSFKSLCSRVSRMSVARLRKKWELSGKTIQGLQLKNTQKFWDEKGYTRAYELCGICAFCSQFFQPFEESKSLENETDANISTCYPLILPISKNCNTAAGSESLALQYRFPWKQQQVVEVKLKPKVATPPRQPSRISSKRTWNTRRIIDFATSRSSMSNDCNISKKNLRSSTKKRGRAGNVYLRANRSYYAACKALELKRGFVNSVKKHQN